MVRRSAPALHPIVRAAVVVGVVVLAIGTRPLSVAQADSPFDDPAFQLPQGGGTGTDSAAARQPIAAIPAGYSELSLPSPAFSASVGTPYRQQAALQNPNDPRSWLQLGFNPGKWLLDSVLGAVSGIILSVAGVFQTLALWGVGAPDSVSTSASHISESIMFSTPLRYTTGWGGGVGSTQSVYDIVRLASISICSAATSPSPVLTAGAVALRVLDRDQIRLLVQDDSGSVTMRTWPAGDVLFTLDELPAAAHMGGVWRDDTLLLAASDQQLWQLTFAPEAL